MESYISDMRHTFEKLHGLIEQASKIKENGKEAGSCIRLLEMAALHRVRPTIRAVAVHPNHSGKSLW